MEEDHNEHLRELCEKATVEEDRQKRLEITNEINQLFLEQEKDRVAAKAWVNGACD
jgi:hypothetical protein